MDNCYTLAVTGQMGSGKSYVCRELFALAKNHYLPVSFLAVDDIRRLLLEDDCFSQGAEVRAQFLDFFGKEIVLESGQINRRRLSEVVYCESEALAFYNSVLVKAYREIISEQQSKSKGILLLEWANIIEDQSLDLSDYNTLLVTCSQQVQFERLRDSELGWETSQLRLVQQLDPSARRASILALQKKFGRGHFFGIDTDTTPNQRSLTHLLFSIFQIAGVDVYEQAVAENR